MSMIHAAAPSVNFASEWNGLDDSAFDADLGLAAAWALEGFVLLARGSYSFAAIDAILEHVNEHGTAVGSGATPADAEAIEAIFRAHHPADRPEAEAPAFEPSAEDLEWKSVMDARDQAEEDLYEVEAAAARAAVLDAHERGWVFA